MRKALRDKLEVGFGVSGMNIRVFDELLSESDFGRLPEQDQFELGERLIGAVGSYKVSFGFQRDQPKEVAERLRKIADSAECLRNALSARNDVAEQWLFTALQRAACARDPTTKIDAQGRWNCLISALTDLRSAAESSASVAAERSLRGSQRSRGGKARSGPGPKEQLNYKIFEIYSDFHKRLTADWQPSCDEILKRFVRKVYQLVDSSGPSFKGPDGRDYAIGFGPVGPKLAVLTDLNSAIVNSYKRWIRSKRKKL